MVASSSAAATDPLLFFAGPGTPPPNSVGFLALYLRRTASGALRSSARQIGGAAISSYPGELEPLAAALFKCLRWLSRRFNLLLKPPPPLAAAALCAPRSALHAAVQRSLALSPVAAGICRPPDFRFLDFLADAIVVSGANGRK